MKIESCRRVAIGATCLLLATHCRPSAKIVQADPQFSGKSLKDRALLVLPIAVTHDYGDERTGITLDHESRERATKLICAAAPDVRDDVKVVCFDRPELVSSSALLKEILLDYARDHAVTVDRWHELEQKTGAGFVLLFRPEGVSASQKVKKASTSTSVRTIAFPGPVPFVVLPTESVGPRVDSVKTSRTYTLSSCLVDLHQGKVVRVGTQSAKDSTSTTEPPNASEHLFGIMRDLMKGLLAQ